jgi:hypothetical protein
VTTDPPLSGSATHESVHRPARDGSVDASRGQRPDLPFTVTVTVPVALSTPSVTVTTAV